MKRCIAVLLTGCLAFQTWMSGSVLVQAESGSSISEQTLVQMESALEVEVHSSLLAPYKGKVTVQVSNSSKAVQESKELDFRESDSLSARFPVSQGDYTVSIQAERFADYTQQVHAEAGWVTKILVCSDKIETGSESVPGWICPGDVNHDGRIDKEDTNAMLKEIRENPQGTDMDINNDGKTDIADLQCIVQSIDESRQSQVQKLGLVQAVQAVEGTAIQGNVEEFLNDSGSSIRLTPLSTTEAISSENPVSIRFTLAQDEITDVSLIPKIQGITLHAPTEMDEEGTINSDITDGEAVVVTVDENGEEQETVFSLAEQGRKAAMVYQEERMEDGLAVNTADRAAANIEAHVSIEADGSLILDFGTQIAVKRVTIKITGTKKTEPLVDIAKVEFVNNMESRIPAPQLDIPTLNVPKSENESLTVSWNAQRNVTGYEVYVSGPVNNQNSVSSEIVRVSSTQHRISTINGNNLKNFTTYVIKVRSVNGDWHSPWSAEQLGEPKPQSVPDAPDNVSATGGYRTITVSWKNMKDSNGYMVYYKKSKDTDSEYRPAVDGFTQLVSGVGKINTAHYTIGGLEDDTEYSLYVVGWNELGWGKASLVSVASTKSTAPPQLPKYKLLNTSNGTGTLSAHIVSAAYGGSGGARMVGSALDTAEGSAWGLVDDDYGSYWMKEDWDDGVAYPADSKGVTVTLDQDYQMNYITFAAVDQTAGVQTVRLRYWNAGNGSMAQIANVRMFEKMDENNKPFYIVKMDRTVTANKIHLCLGRNGSSKAAMKIGEIHFHQYDSLEDDIMALYEDEMHTTLRADVTEEAISSLEARLNTVDEGSGEKHPLYKELSLELQTAKDILKENLKPSYVVDNRITAQKDGHLGFSGLNAWQPLGKVAYQGEKLLVFVGHNTRRTGDSTNLQLVFTQYYSESSALAKTVSLKVGRNEITVPQISSKDFERGGQIYVAYTGNSSSDKYAVRVGGGSDIPVLNVYGKTGNERTEAIRTYVEDLESYVTTIQNKHDSIHTGTKNVNYAYNQTNCILNATDIMMREMMYSLPATQVWAGIRSADDKAAKLDNALQAMEQAMTLFYQHKGLSDKAGTARGNNAIPAQHLNIRYMRMFSGAFMYAAGNHIGIEWGSTTGLSAANNLTGFGWGIAHEIGHNINQGSYAVAEVTNNYFAQLLTGKRRYTYANVYKKVTSGTVGRASNVFTQLALYWQLHLAFDDNTDDRYIYDNYEQQFNDLFFARVDTYSRNPGKAPQSGLTLNGGTDQNLMRLACAAANKNILPFFERWGMVPDDTTTAYAGKYGEADTKALYYVNEDARNYRVAHSGEEGTILNRDVVTAHVAAQSNQVEVTISTDADADVILGYEVSRSITSNGEKKTEVIGFVPIDTAESTVYADTVACINNRVMEYEVRAVDKYLNYSKKSAAGSAKIQTDGVLDKTLWTVTSDMTSDDDTVIDTDDDDPDNGYYWAGAVDAKKVNSIERILDNDKTDAGTFKGNSADTAVIVVDMHKTEQVTALKYLGDAVKDVTVEVSKDGRAWTAVKEHYKGITQTAEENTVWFDSVKENTRENWIGTYDARYVRITLFQSGSISIREIEICGPSGDNLEFMTAEGGQPAIGVLSADYQYGDKAADVIPKGSLIFSGNYKGNPAYNVVVLYDTEGNVIGAKDGNVQAGQVIFADVPPNGNLGETSNGTWVYYVEPGQWDMQSIQKLGGVRGELYRVDDAKTLEGERIVSDTLVISIPETLPAVTLQ